MAEPESDGIAEVFDDGLRLAITAAGRVAEQRVRQREQQLRDAQAQSEQTAGELQARFEAERAAAVGELSAVSRPQWWDQAQPREIAQAWQTAETWREVDPQAAQTSDDMRSRLRERYGIDPDQLETDPALTAPSQATSRGGEAEAAVIMTGAARDEQREQAAYDTQERRGELSDALVAAGVSEDAVQTRVLADTSQALPPAGSLRGLRRRRRWGLRGSCGRCRPRRSG